MRESVDVYRSIRQVGRAATKVVLPAERTWPFTMNLTKEELDEYERTGQTAEKGETLMLPRNVTLTPWFCLCCLQWFQRTAPLCMIVPGHAFQGSVCQGCKIKDEYCRAKLPATSYHDRMRQLTGLKGVALTDYIKGRLT